MAHTGASVLLLLLVLGMHQTSWASKIVIATFPILSVGDKGSVSSAVTVSDQISSSLLKSGTPVLPWKAVSAGDVSTICQQMGATGKRKFSITLIDRGSPDSPQDRDIQIESIAGCGASIDEAGTEAVLVDDYGVKCTLVCPRDAGSVGCPIYKTGADVTALYNDEAGPASRGRMLDAGGGGGIACVPLGGPLVGCPSPPPSKSCFPGDATVRMANGKLKQMVELKLGDKIAVRKADGAIAYEDIYAFGHKDASAVAEFLMISMVPAGVENFKGQGSRSLELTTLHFAPISSGIGEQEIVYRRAKDIKVGDTMWAVPEVANVQAPDQLVAYVVTGIVTTIKRGLYNPFTMTGTVVVNGVVASVHSEWFLDGIFDALGLPHLLPLAYQVVLAPPRLLYTILGKDTYISVYTWLDSRINFIQFVSDYSGEATSISIACIIAAPFLILLSSTKKKEI